MMKRTQDAGGFVRRLSLGGVGSNGGNGVYGVRGKIIYRRASHRAMVAIVTHTLVKLR